MSNIQTGAERMPHDLSHLGFLAGQIGRLITISTTPVIAGDSFEMDAVGALRLSPLRRGLAIDSTVDIFMTIFVILVVWYLLPRVARLMIHTPTAISIFVCLSMVQLMAVFISMRCTLCGHFLQVALTLILVVGYAIAAS